MACISVRKTMANLPKAKLKLLFGLTPKIQDPVPRFALEPSVNQFRVSSGNTGSLFLQQSLSIMTLKILEG
jgi:hypothetical protein